MLESFVKSLRGRACLVAVALGSGVLGAFAASTGSSVVVEVAMADFAFALKPRSVSGGDVTFRVKNVGAVQHDFVLVGLGGSKVLEAGGAEDVSIKLAPGSYEYRCTVPGHAEAGMKGVLTVN